MEIKSAKKAVKINHLRNVFGSGALTVEPAVESRDVKPLKKLGYQKEKKCYRCGDTGHVVRNCPKLDRETG